MAFFAFLSLTLSLWYEILPSYPLKHPGVIYVSAPGLG